MAASRSSRFHVTYAYQNNKNNMNKQQMDKVRQSYRKGGGKWNVVNTTTDDGDFIPGYDQGETRPISSGPIGEECDNLEALSEANVW